MRRLIKSGEGAQAVVVSEDAANEKLEIDLTLHLSRQQPHDVRQHRLFQVAYEHDATHEYQYGESKLASLLDESLDTSRHTSSSSSSSS